MFVERVILPRQEFESWDERLRLVADPPPGLVASIAWASDGRVTSIKITDKPLWRPHPPSHYSHWPLSGPLLAGHVQTGIIEEQWDELARIGGSLKLGYVSASLLVARLQAGARQHPLAKALLEYGKLLRTIHALRWFTDEVFRRRIGRQLHKGESLNEVRRFLAYANAGKEKYPATRTRRPRPTA